MSGLDDQYNTRLWAPDFKEALELQVEMGRAIRAGDGVRRDLKWGAGPHQTIDLHGFRPGVSRAVLFIHGGYWQYRGSGAAGGAFLAPAFLDERTAFAAMSYELCPDVDMDAMVAQPRRAILWLLDEARRVDARIERLIVIGHSAGAHLAAMAALADWRGAHGMDNPVSAVCGVSGLYDLRPLVSTYLNDALRMNPDQARRCSPLACLRVGAPPFILGVGERESPAFIEQSSGFSAACGEAAIPAECHLLGGYHHYDAIRALTATDHPLARGVRALLRHGLAY